MKLFTKFLLASLVVNAVLMTAYTAAYAFGGVGVEAALAVFLIFAFTAIAYRDAAKRMQA
ncbi:hypothetical protein AD940_01150 [Gluconobacter thailandicus]|uniref:hypothetical protein n=1 Tax=Gluconobacter thailandicus TaxID=257438 RepID=UPI0007771C16|nr:hypothetical protein [Gluconobacter thailandicus]KXV35908.1 hypothetical protein AD940_01150 [Gluconobacter thailandicus]